MDRRKFLSSLASALAAASLPRSVDAQGAAKVVRIGWLTAQQAPSLAPYVDAMRDALADLGYVEGRNLVIEFRYGNDAIERVPQLAAELVRLPVDLIVAQGAAVPVISTLGLTVPIVYVFSGDPVSAGFANSLARPRGNMTGLTFMAAELNGKRLELLRDIIPELRRVAIVANPEHPGEHLERAYTEETGRKLGLTVDYFPTRTRDELATAFTAMTADPPQAISLFADGFAIQYRQSIIDFAMSRRAPVISGWPVFAKSGALCTYGPRLTDSYRRLAYYVDRVLKSTKPADLPIEQPTKFELVVNLRTATALGLTVPQSVLVRADEVIE
jgi:putative tryptophan/tyrosine transport system substrate-binding protein